MFGYGGYIVADHLGKLAYASISFGKLIHNEKSRRMCHGFNDSRAHFVFCFDLLIHILLLRFFVILPKCQKKSTIFPAYALFAVFSATATNIFQDIIGSKNAVMACNFPVYS